MFEPIVYSRRREALRKILGKGVVLLPGNKEAAMNYPANTYHFRQDSNFLYFFGLNQPDLAGVIDLDGGVDILFGDDFTLEDIIWMGPQPSMAERAALVGVEETRPLDELPAYLAKAMAEGRKIHFVPAYRGETQLWLAHLLGIRPAVQKNYASRELIKAIVALREIKEDQEVEEIEKMIDVAYLMHTTAMQMAHPGITEQEIFGRMEGIAFSKANGTSFPIILSINGQTLHNHYHGNMLAGGQLMVSDAGAESAD
ncbi:MAG: aminopeptidase P N-terminal domain-containing protein, partial [Bacteroidales bacterium]